jgi:hypothetical protein
MKLKADGIMARHRLHFYLTDCAADHNFGDAQLWLGQLHLIQRNSERSARDHV